jgi:hypothetical protein
VRSVLGKNTTKKKSKSPPKKSVRPGAIHGRTIRRLPIEKSIKTGEDLKAKWDFMLLSGHGDIQNNPVSYIKVPERTYIMFLAPTGCTIKIPDNGMYYDDILTTNNEKDFYNNMLEEIKNPKGLLETFTNATSLKLTRAIYTPNTEMPEMEIIFENKDYDWMLLGLYKLPIILDKKRLKSLSTIYHLYRTQRMFNVDYFTFDGPFYNLLQNNIHNKEPLLLSDLLKKFPPVPEGKTRLLIVQSCRAIKDDCPKATEKVRRFSVGLRSISKENETS